jgi:hypothetical protein
VLSSVDIGLKISSSYREVGAPMRAGKLPALEYISAGNRVTARSISGKWSPFWN